MNAYYITGTTSGLGAALKNKLSSNIINSIDRKDCDLRFIDQIIDYEFKDCEADNYVLINNAAWIGPLDEVGDQNPYDIVRLFNANLIGPCILTNKFIQKFGHKDHIIVNISGAGWGQHIMPNMSLYAASKAALTQFTKIINKEDNTKVIGILPGGMNSKMQEEIRLNTPELQADPNILRDPNIIANYIAQILDDPDKYNALVNIPDEYFTQKN